MALIKSAPLRNSRFSGFFESACSALDSAAASLLLRFGAGALSALSAVVLSCLRLVLMVALFHKDTNRCVCIQQNQTWLGSIRLDTLDSESTRHECVSVMC